ncbi:MAG: hypothetical protein ACFFD4_07055 [Candidatus Odinarchaeota archaeon]
MIFPLLTGKLVLWDGWIQFAEYIKMIKRRYLENAEIELAAYGELPVISGFSPSLYNLR